MATAEFSKFAGKLSAALSQSHLPGFEIAQLEFHHLHWICLEIPRSLPGKTLRQKLDIWLFKVQYYEVKVAEIQDKG